MDDTQAVSGTNRYITHEELERRFYELATDVAIIRQQTCELRDAQNENRRLQQEVELLKAQVQMLTEERQEIPQYIQQFTEEIGWLRNRYADIDRIFGWENMILNGIKK